MSRTHRPPAFLFYPDDFSSDGKVEAMTTEEVGAYILLLCKSWREDPPGSIPTDDAVLARWARLTPDRWAECRMRVLAPFTLGTDSRWRQHRLRSEFNNLLKARQKKQEAGVIGASARWQPHASAMATAVAKDAISSSSSISSSNSNSKALAQKPVEGELFGFAVFWKAYPKHIGKEAAKRAWISKVRDDSLFPEVIAGLEIWKKTEQWQDHKYIPYPATFLNQKRWKDEVTHRGSEAKTSRGPGIGPSDAGEPIKLNPKYARVQ